MINVHAHVCGASDLLLAETCMCNHHTKYLELLLLALIENVHRLARLGILFGPLKR